MKHITTEKHICNTKILNDNNSKKSQYVCVNCGKQYKHLSGLSRHKVNCKDGFTIEDKDYIRNQQEQIQTLQNLLEKSIENNTSTLNNIIPKIGNTTNNISNQMTINVFLNEECKNAMNLTEFMDQLHLSLDDLQYTKAVSYTHLTLPTN